MINNTNGIHWVSPAAAALIERSFSSCLFFLCIRHVGPYLSSIYKHILEKRIAIEIMVKVRPTPIASIPGATLKIANAAVKHLYRV